MAVCPECGSDNPEGSFTCGTCGGFLPAVKPAGGGGVGPSSPEAAPPGAPSEWRPEMAGETGPPGAAPRQSYVPPTKLESSSKKVIWVAVAGVVLLVAVVVALVLVMSGGSGNPDEAIQLVKEYLDSEDSLFDSSMFKNWEASGPAEDMTVSAIFDISTFGEEYGGVPGGYYNQKFEWKVNLDTREVTPMFLGEDLPVGYP